VSECIAYLSEYETLEPGDIIMTGTPEGVNAVLTGDVMRGTIAGLGAIEISIKAEAAVPIQDRRQA
jgi:fumarylpyruvate hydrolase